MNNRVADWVFMQVFQNNAMELEVIHNCPACFGQHFTRFAVSDGLNIARCADCSLIFSNPRVPQSVTRNFFEETYLESKVLIDENMTSFRRAPLLRTAALVKHHLPEGGRLLDVGAASGLFLSLFANDARWSAAGVEPSRNAARNAAERYGVEIHCGFVDTVDLPGDKFDVVTILDTFFLDPEPNRTLSIIKGKLRPGGLLVFEIPGLSFRLLKNTGIVSRLLYGNPAQLNPSMQMFYYEEKTLSKLLSRYGFELISTSPEQSPIYGNWLKRALNHLYFRSSTALYTLTRSRVHLAPKEVLVYRNSGHEC